jgi:hypothetical protein
VLICGQESQVLPMLLSNCKRSLGGSYQSFVCFRRMNSRQICFLILDVTDLKILFLLFNLVCGFCVLEKYRIFFRFQLMCMNQNLIFLLYLFIYIFA